MSPDQDGVLVAMSGGVDSSVAAALLVERGERVIGAFMSNGVKASAGRSHRQGCCSVDDAADARRVAAELDVPFYAVNLADGFAALIDDFVESYVSGRTPNPCIECNRRFKMGALLDLARRLGVSRVATGHYARLSERGGRFAVERGRDADKDQSYVLFPLDQDALAHTLLPLGDLGKDQVRAEARRLGLRTADKPESMEICFVPGGDYRELVRKRRPDALRSGAVVDAAGRVIGRHAGTAGFTVGQRRGLPGGHQRPLYVSAIDPSSATVTVGPREQALCDAFLVESPVWSGCAPAKAGTELEGVIQVRHRHAGTQARLRVRADGRLSVTTREPIHAVAPGQAAVLFEQGRIQVGGWIARGETVGEPRD